MYTLSVKKFTRNQVQERINISEGFVLSGDLIASLANTNGKYRAFSNIRPFVFILFESKYTESN